MHKTSILVISTIALAATLGCQPESKESDETHQSNRKLTSISINNFTEGTWQGYSNLIDPIDFNIHTVPKWQPNEPNSNEDWTLDLLPTMEQELDEYRRGQLLSYGSLILTDLSAYQRIRIDSDVQISDTSLAFKSSPNGCDVLVEAYELLGQSTTMSSNGSICFGDSGRTFDSLHAYSHTLGVDTLSMLWYAKNATLRPGLSESPDTALSASNFRIYGGIYDQPLVANTYKLQQDHDNNQRCPQLTLLAGELTVSSDYQVTGAIKTSEDELSIQSVGDSTDVLSIQVKLSSTNANFNGLLQLQNYPKIALEIQQNSCLSTSIFKRQGTETAQLQSEDLIFDSNNHSAYPPIILPAKTVNLSNARLEEGKGINLTPIPIQADVQGPVSIVQSPEILRKNNDYLLIEYALQDIDNRSNENLSVRALANFGNGWVLLGQHESLTSNNRMKQIIIPYLPSSDSVRFALMTYAKNLSPLPMNRSIYLESIELTNVKRTPLEDNDKTRLHLNYRPIIDEFTCDSGDLKEVQLVYDWENQRLISDTDEGLSIDWPVNDAMEYSGSINDGGKPYHFNGKLSGDTYSVANGSCYSVFMSHPNY